MIRFFLVLTLLAGCGACGDETDRYSPRSDIILLKADDLRLPVQPAFQRYFDLLAELGIDGSAGIITGTIDDADEEHRDGLRHLEGRQDVRIWLHGYEHYCTEFDGPSLEEQAESLRKSLEALAKVGITSDVWFGAPCNAVDANTYAAVDLFPQITRVIGIKHRPLNIEQPTHRPATLKKFAKDLDALPNDGSFLVLQLHPTSWTEQEWQRVHLILIYLQARGVTFINDNIPDD